MGSPVTGGTWTGFEGAFYTGLGGNEFLWLAVSVVMIVLALVLGERHERQAYSEVERKK